MSLSAAVFYPRKLVLPENQVHLWNAGLDIEPAERNCLAATLSAHEKARAARFYFDQDRERFITGRGILRQILSRYLGCEAQAMEFGYGPYGKPFLISNSAGPQLRFNVAHSHGLALFGFARNREIGVDLERIDHGFASHQIAESLFSRPEYLMLQKLPDSQQKEAFFSCWTRKEAYVKAHGAGLQMPFDSFDVSLMPLQLLNSENRTWVITAPKVAHGYCAAIVVEGNSCDHKIFEWKAPCPNNNLESRFYSDNTAFSARCIQVQSKGPEIIRSS